MSTETNGTNLRILTYNLYIRPPGITARGNDYKKERMKEFLDTAIDNYDVICFEELFGSFTSKRTKFIEKAKKHGFLYHYSSHRPMYPVYPVDGGVVILSRYPIIEKSTKIFTRGCYSDGASSKGVIHALIQVNDKKVHVFTTHTQADYYGTDEENKKSIKVRGKQLKQCCKFIKKTVRDNFPIILCGDFNVIGESHLYNDLIELMRSYEFQVDDLLFNDKGTHPVTHALNNDGHAADNVITYKENEIFQWNIRLDYIFSLKLADTLPIKVNSVNVNEFRSSGNLYPFISDHFGVEASISI